MKVWVWEYADQVSMNYHSGGGVVVFAESEDSARALANEQPGCHIKETDAPDHVRVCADGDPMVFIFPDAGCC